MSDFVPLITEATVEDLVAELGRRSEHMVVNVDLKPDTKETFQRIIRWKGSRAAVRGLAEESIDVMREEQKFGRGMDTMDGKGNCREVE